MRSGKVASGVWLCLALFVFAGGVMFAFYRAAHDVTHPSDSAIGYGVPTLPGGLASFNAHRESHLPDKVIEAILRGNPDYLFLQETHGKMLPELQRQLGGKFIATAYYPLQNLPDADNDIGNAILSKHPLEEGRPIPNHMKGACGVWASSVVDGKRFYVACLRLSEAGSGEARDELANFGKAWESLGRPPMIAAVESGAELQPPAGLSVPASDREWLMSGEWRVADAAVAEGVRSIKVNVGKTPGAGRGD